MDALRPVVAAADIGGTKIAVALVDAQGEVVARGGAPTPAREGADAILDLVARLVADLADRQGGPAPEALGVGAAGVIDPVSGRVLLATDTLTGWEGAELCVGLESRLQVPVSAVNDVHAHGLGELQYGAGVGSANVLTVAVGTGIGGAVVLADDLVVGRHAAAGHVGHVPSGYAAGLVCSCGAVGHLEAFASGPGLAREYQRRTGGGAIDLREVAARAAQHESVARNVLRAGGAAVGEAVAGFVNVLDPDLVVLGGGVAGVGGVWWSALLEAYRAGVLPLLSDTAVVRSELGGDAALVGAAALAWRSLEEGQ